MLCRKPFMAGNVPFGCGQCQPCRINRRRLWTWRMYLESLVSDGSSFVTLTYAPEKLPDGGTLVPRHLQLWLKRLRFRHSNRTVRFFACGEYGDLTERPHYHAALFGLGPEFSESISTTWPHGFVSVYEFNETTAQYIAGYVVKKMTAKNDPRLKGRYPEFARMSLRPGLGAGAMDIVLSVLRLGPALESVRASMDVPTQLQLGRKLIPLGRYLRGLLRKKFGMTPDDIQAVTDSWSLEKSQEMLAMCLDAGVSPSPVAIKASLLEHNLGRIQAVEARQKISRGKKL